MLEQAGEEFCVVPMELSHLDEVLKIEEQSFPTPWSKYAFTCELLDNDFSRYFCLIYGDRVIGYMGVWIILDEAHITNVAISPEYRNQRLGDYLMQVVTQNCLALGAVRMTLEVRVSNLAAQNLYTRLGFKSAGIRRGYYTDTKEDAIIMWKEILHSTAEGKP
ncbi:MAG TPA: ribosomal protein S18-alanine N-acetyltransferase [Verrucomicrobiae bacterium]|nr:ribosomal protein S18-alanine N-acetyltransferase [Verrucomicrobiae bacterium]